MSTGCQKDRKTGGQTDRRTDRHTDRKTNETFQLSYQNKSFSECQQDVKASVRQEGRYTERRANRVDQKKNHTLTVSSGISQQMKTAFCQSGFFFGPPYSMTCSQNESIEMKDGTRSISGFRVVARVLDYELCDVGYRFFLWLLQTQDLVLHGIVWYCLTWYGSLDSLGHD